MPSPTLQQAVDEYLRTVALSRSERTARIYASALQVLSEVLVELGLDPQEVGRRRWTPRC